MTTWTDPVILIKPELSTNLSLLTDSSEMRLDFNNSKLSWIGDNENIDISLTPLVNIASTSKFGSINNNVLGTIVSLGGNGSNRPVVVSKEYYWHL